MLLLRRRPGPTDRQIRTFVDRIAGLGLHPRPRMLAHALPVLFEGVELAGTDVLDIGGGSGTLGLFAGFCGARSVVLVEPEAAGSDRGATSRFEEAARTLGLASARLEAATIQDLSLGDARFDLLLLHNSVNHFDEQACIDLGHSAEARQRYDQVFAKLAGLSRPGATLILSDCSPRNFWPLVGRRNPFARSIEWHKHQPPEIWRDLLAVHGFSVQALRWSSPSSLGRSGRALLGNQLGAFFFSSHFNLVLRKA